MEKIEIATPTIPLNKLLKYAALVPSGGQAKALILDGEVSLNGEPCFIIRKKVKPGDVITFMDQEYQVVEEDAD